MYSTVIEVIGSHACSLTGPACSGAEAVNMGLVVLAFVGLAWTMAVISIRRARRRDYF
jgi:hypothetical protein